MVTNIQFGSYFPSGISEMVITLCVSTAAEAITEAQWNAFCKEQTRDA